ncbi:MAG TPA: DinB family protein [Chitinophagaceae bacterium]|nr:DinB family protein [Chitinophagaceae bacterium]
MRPELSRVPEFYHKYVNQVPDNDLMTAFKTQTQIFIDFLKKMPSDKIDYAYAPGKWTIKEVLQHVTDAERVFSYRALRFARKDATPLAGFDENLFAENANASKRDWNDLVEEFETVRKSTEYLFSSFDEEQLNATGTASNASNYVLAFGYICVGHPLHHKKVIEERYLK